MKKEIFKVQLPLASNDPEPMAMIYNQNRSSQGLVPVTDDLKKIMGKEFKKFVWAKHRPDGVIEIIREAEWQEW